MKKTQGARRVTSKNQNRGSVFFSMSLKDLNERVRDVHAADRLWDRRIADAGNHGRPDDAAGLMYAAQRDKERAKFWWDDANKAPRFFPQPEAALDYLGDALKECAGDIRAEWKGKKRDEYARRSIFTEDFSVIWRLQEIQDALRVLYESEFF